MSFVLPDKFHQWLYFALLGHYILEIRDFVLHSNYLLFRRNCVLLVLQSHSKSKTLEKLFVK